MATNPPPAASGNETAPDSPRVCPKCKSPRVYRSHRRGLMEEMYSRFSLYPYRCHACEHRFLVKRPSMEREHGKKDPRPDLRKRKMKRLMRDLIIGAVCVLIFVVFLYYLIQPRDE